MRKAKKLFAVFTAILMGAAFSATVYAQDAAFEASGLPAAREIIPALAAFLAALAVLWVRSRQKKKRAAQTSAPPAREPAAAPESGPTDVTPARCPLCGQKLSPQDRFCPSCGNKIG